MNTTHWMLCRLGIHNWLYVGDVVQTVRRCKHCRKVQTWDYLLARERGVIRWKSV